MKNAFISAALLVVAAGSWAFYPKVADESTGHMMVISTISGGFNAQAFVTVVAPDGSQQEREIEFKKGSAKKLAANMTEVHKEALASINEYTRKGWHVVGTAPNGVTSAGGTVFNQIVYILEKR